MLELSSFSAADGLLFVRFYCAICWIDNISDPCWDESSAESERLEAESCQITVTILIKNRFNNMTI